MYVCMYVYSSGHHIYVYIVQCTPPGQPANTVVILTVVIIMLVILSSTSNNTINTSNSNRTTNNIGWHYSARPARQYSSRECTHQGNTHNKER